MVCTQILHTLQQASIDNYNSTIMRLETIIRRGSRDIAHATEEACFTASARAPTIVGDLYGGHQHV